MIVGASWSMQLIAALTAFGFGALGGIPALLYKRRAKPLERALTDFAATIVLTALFLASCELGSKGQLCWYTPLFFIVGTCISFRLTGRAFALIRDRLPKRQKENRRRHSQPHAEADAKGTGN